MQEYIGVSSCMKTVTFAICLATDKVTLFF